MPRGLRLGSDKYDDMANFGDQSLSNPPGMPRRPGVNWGDNYTAVRPIPNRQAQAADSTGE